MACDIVQQPRRSEQKRVSIIFSPSISTFYDLVHLLKFLESCCVCLGNGEENFLMWCGIETPLYKILISSFYDIRVLCLHLCRSGCFCPRGIRMCHISFNCQTQGVPNHHVCRWHKREVSTVRSPSCYPLSPASAYSELKQCEQSLPINATIS